MDETLQIDRIRCDGHGLCAELLPELVALDDWGYPIIKSGPVPARLIEHARRAVDACPVLALRLARASALAVAPAANGRLRPAASARLQTG
jgi:ferredoxin